MKISCNEQMKFRSIIDIFTKCQYNIYQHLHWIMCCVVCNSSISIIFSILKTKVYRFTKYTNFLFILYCIPQLIKCLKTFGSIVRLCSWVALKSCTYNTIIQYKIITRTNMLLNVWPAKHEQTKSNFEFNQRMKIVQIIAT